METKQQLLKEITDLQRRVESMKEEPNFETGKWYKSISGSIINYTGTDKEKWFGISDLGNWHNHGWSIELNDLTPATDKEVEDALIKEAVKRGYELGKAVYVEFKPYLKYSYELMLQGNKFKWFPISNELSYGEHIILRDGQWATIIDDKIEIGGYEVKRGGNGNNKYTLIDGNIFTKQFWKAAKLISEHSKAKIMVDCSKQFDVSLETINKILDKL